VAPRGQRRPGEEAPQSKRIADVSVIRTFLDQLFGGIAEGEQGHLQTTMQLPVWSGAKKCTAWCSSLQEAAEACARISDKGENVYFHVCLHDPEIALAEARRKAKGRKRDPSKVALKFTRGCVQSATVIGGLWSDEDHALGEHEKTNLPPDRDAVLANLRKLPDELRPSLVFESGGGFYPWWIFKEPWELRSDTERARAGAICRRLQHYLHEVIASEYEHDSTPDLARILRPPGVINHKYGCIVSLADMEA
jgi:hypothetical protein